MHKWTARPDHAVRSYGTTILILHSYGLLQTLRCPGSYNYYLYAHERTIKCSLLTKAFQGAQYLSFDFYRDQSLTTPDLKAMLIRKLVIRTSSEDNWKPRMMTRDPVCR
jgi:hypothetical protein